MSTVTGQGLLDWDEQGPQADLLRSMLTIAVPLWMERRRDWSDEQLIGHARVVWLGENYAASQHEALLYKVKKRRHNGKQVPGTAEVFNFFADAVACMALVAAGGVNVLGLHFCQGECERCRPDGAS